MAIGALLVGLFTVIDPHVRTEIPDLRALVREGAQRSATFRSLVARLDDSDVVVYVEYDRQSIGDVRGLLTLVGTHWDVGARRCFDTRVAVETGWQVLKEIRRRDPRSKPEAADAHNLHDRHGGVLEASPDGGIH